MPLLTPAESAAADERARTAFGVPESVLMENAGRAAALLVDRMWPRGVVAGVAGSGNNGGDLVVMLRTLKAWGRDVALIQGASRPPDPALAHGFDLQPLTDDAALAALSRADVLVDGILGTGATGAPRPDAAAWIERLDTAGRPVVALDLPSGVDATTGRVHEPAVHADLTICFGWAKLGLMLHPARAHCGRIVAVEIGFPPDVHAATAAVLTPEWVRHRMRERPAVSHKGSAGRLLIHAGSMGMAGAAALAAEAAFRAGVGLVRIASPACNREVLQAAVREATYLDADAIGDDDIDAMHALVAGPGLGTDANARRALERVLGLTADVRTLLDADALNMLATEPDTLTRLGAERPLVITPHARELARLTGTDIDDILADTPGAARAAAARFGCVVLLKGTPSLIASPDGALLVGSTGSSDLATAGMGDQLAGVIGAFLAGGHDPAEAAGLALYLCGRAADRVNAGRSLMPRDVTAALPDAMRDPGPAAGSSAFPFVLFDQPARW
ncbi:MAG TPA: NAD(P)H-hydrate dehydratase [Longimicrobiales bacterium]|nr:NAD(P)H-hydrate dehydratase [Longimicrobiales bacterium]